MTAIKNFLAAIWGWLVSLFCSAKAEPEQEPEQSAGETEEIVIGETEQATEEQTETEAKSENDA